MFTQLTTVIAFAFTMAVNAVPQNNQNVACTSGETQCCSSVQTAQNNGSLSDVLRGVGAVVNSGIPVGVDGSPFVTLGVSGTSCSGQVVCCQNNKFSGVVALGCMALNVGA
ncbi:hypothetical protein NP233_g9144 [Leucocoprinus birnbaumii]|uniref:Hydrophobin n=1 Tax=Leucocoprinus birnbaumii TaxID=56174 RepID=A0AAD5YMH5_9AGAR|nr:hypothetical protein NP233_g9144 [Leucocoprinus birnbaumii]